jgi:threonyl-tRNA synthetase
MNPAVSSKKITVTFPDQSKDFIRGTTTGNPKKNCNQAVLKRPALAVKINGELSDLATPLQEDAKLNLWL